MKAKHISNYMKHFDIGDTDNWHCEVCMKEFHINNGLQIHHIIYRSHGGTDDVKNCISLCVNCHTKAHGGDPLYNKGQLQLIHGYFLQGTRKIFIR